LTSGFKDRLKAAYLTQEFGKAIEQLRTLKGLEECQKCIEKIQILVKKLQPENVQQKEEEKVDDQNSEKSRKKELMMKKQKQMMEQFKKKQELFNTKNKEILEKDSEEKKTNDQAENESISN